MLASKLKKNYKYSWRVNHPCGLLLTAASATSLNLKQLAQQQERGQNHGKIFPLPPAGYCQAVQLHLVHMQWDCLVGAGHPRVSLQHFTVYAVAFTGIWASRRRLRTWRKIYDASNYIQKRNGEIPSVRHPTMEVGSSIPSPRARMYSQKWAFRQRLHLLVMIFLVTGSQILYTLDKSPYPTMIPSFVFGSSFLLFSSCTCTKTGEPKILRCDTSGSLPCQSSNGVTFLVLDIALF